MYLRKGSGAADVFCQVSVIRSNPRRRASKLPAIGHSLEPLAASRGRQGRPACLQTLSVVKKEVGSSEPGEEEASGGLR